jgi:general secretion pathway protein J
MSRGRTRGFTLLELLIAIAILASISLIIYGAFASMKDTRDGLQRVGDRYREGRIAMTRIAHELESAYLSAHQPINTQLAVVKTAFIGTRGTPADRVDFNAFANRRLDRDSHESDQAEISFFGASDPKHQGVVDLVRRVNPRLDIDPQKGGRIEVLATDIDLFDLEYLDPLTGQWTETWDTRQAIGQANRLPLQVRVLLVLNGGSRSSAGRGRETIRLITKVALPIQKPLTFATQ